MAEVERPTITPESVALARRVIGLVVNRMGLMPANTSIAQQRRHATGGQTAYHGARDYGLVLGRPERLAFEDYLLLYERGGIAGQLIDGYAADTWGEPPKVREDGEEDTPFVEEWNKLVARLHVWDVLRRADALSGIGEYGVLMFGLAGGDSPGQPVKKGSAKGPEGLLWLRPFHAGDATIDTFDRDPTSPRCGYPETYSIQMERDGNSVEVHHTRVLHLAEHRTSSEVYGRPWLMRTYDTLLDMLYKILGGSAESTWLSMRNPTLLSVKDGWDFDVTDDTAMQGLENNLEALVHDLARFLVAPGWEAQEVGTPNVTDPTGVFGVHMDNVAGATRMPKHIMLGSAAGELASSQADDRRWAGVIRRRQNGYAQPRILEPFIDTLVRYGVLPQPTGEIEIGEADDEGNYNWPSIIQMTAEQDADISLKKAQAIAALRDPATGAVPATEKEQRVVLGQPPDVPEDMVDEPEGEPDADLADMPELTPPEEVGEPDEEEEAARVNALFVGSHVPEIVNSVCPLPDCDGMQAEHYDGHGPLLRCVECRRTYDPTVEGMGEVIRSTDANTQATV